MVPDFRKLARNEIIDLPVYSPGLDADAVRERYGLEEVIKLASNENPLGPSPLVVDAIRREALEVSRYPDGACTRLRKELSRRLEISEQALVFGNGADEIIDMIFFAFVGKDDGVVMGEPTFSSYFLSGMTMGARIEYVVLDEHRHHPGQMLARVTPGTKAVFVGTPHNPTGTICTSGDLELMLEELSPDVLLVWDEAYREYVDDPDYPESIPLVADHPNLVVLRTFSKAYGLAGLRVGYGVAHPGIVEMLEKVRPPFNVNRLAMAAALAALNDTGHLAETISVNRAGKEYLSAEFARLGMETVPTQANFILVRFDGVVDDLAGRLLEKGVIVRDGAALGYPGHVRLTIGTAVQNRAVIRAAEEILECGPDRR